MLCECNKGVEKTTYREALCSVLLTTSFGWSNQEKGDGRGMGDRRGAYRDLVRKPERKETTWKTKDWGDNIKINFQEMGWRHRLD